MVFEDLKLIITGTGRCGTSYVAKSLSSVGVGCGHEAFFRAGGIDEAKDRLSSHRSLLSSNRSYLYEKKWQFGKVEAESSYMAAPYLDVLPVNTVVHLVRNPIRVVFSFVNDFRYFVDTSKSKENAFIHQILPDIKKIDNPLERAMSFYIRWNEMIEKKCKGKKYFRHKIEDDIENIFDFLGIEKPNLYKNKKENTNKYDLYTENIKDLPDGEIKNDFIKKSMFYGYDLHNIKNKVYRLYL